MQFTISTSGPTKICEVKGGFFRVRIPIENENGETTDYTVITKCFDKTITFYYEPGEEENIENEQAAIDFTLEEIKKEAYEWGSKMHNDNPNAIFDFDI